MDYSKEGISAGFSVGAALRLGSSLFFRYRASTAIPVMQHVAKYSRQIWGSSHYFVSSTFVSSSGTGCVLCSRPGPFVLGSRPLFSRLLVASFVLGPRPSFRARGLRSRPALSGLGLLSLFPVPWGIPPIGG